MTNKSYVTVTDQFCGAGGSSIGARAAGAELRLALNHWPLAVKTHNTNFPNAAHDCTDISACNPRRYPSTDILITSPECFPVGTLIITARGLIPIEQVKIDDMVLTHKSRWKRVINTMKSVNNTIILKGQGHPGLEVTPNHPFYICEQTRVWDNSIRDYNRHVYLTPTWAKASELKDRTYRWATPVTFEALPIPEVPGRGMTLGNPDFWWLVGRWLGDGTVRIRPTNSEITIVCGKSELEELQTKLAVWKPAAENLRAEKDELRWRCREIRTAYLFECAHQGLAQWLVENFGKLAHGKTIPTWALTMPVSHRAALLEGYVSADGYISKRKTTIATISKRLAIGIRLLAESLGYRAGVYRYKQHANKIEGRLLNVKDQWVVGWETNASGREAFADEHHSWSLVKHIFEGQEQVEVYNLSVEDDESYVADGIVVHNCTNHSLAKGKVRKGQGQLSMFDDGQIDPDEERSRATMWDVPRFAEYHNYNIIIVENVVDARLWRLWDSWLHAMNSLGYNHEIVYFNSMFAWPTPQSRDRIYVVFWKRGNRAPNLNFNPVAYCARCAGNVHSVQSWKNPKRPYGKYKQQYIYCCPVCAIKVEPYYYCAANAIDWSLPIERIGDRKKPLKPKTMARIEAGLKKFARTGYIVETAYSHADNNRFKGVEEAMPTQPARQTQGLAVPPYLLNTTQRNQDSGYLRALSDASFTQTTGQTMGVVVPPFITEHIHEYRTREATEPLATVVAEGNHHGVVVPPSPFMVFPNQSGDERNRSVEQPLPTQTGSLAPALVTPPPLVVEAYNTSTASPVSDALATVTAGGNHHYLLTPPQPWLMGNYTPGTHRPVTEPMGTVTTQDHHSLIMGLGGASGSRRDINPNEEVLPTQTATRQFGVAVAPWLTSYYGSDLGHPITEGVPTVTTVDRHALVNPAQTQEIRAEDCGFRMLQPHEIGAAMAFPTSYKVEGNSRQKVKQYGNAVTPPVMAMIIERCLETLR